MPIRLHEEDPTLLREAIRFTAAETGFSPRLIEKDYFCSVILEYLAATIGGDLTFKGGTCLSKIHGSFYRLSEDLDFSIPTAPESSRADRSQSVQPVRRAVSELPALLPAFSIIEPLRGANGSTQYNVVVGYASLIDGHVEPVHIEVGVREPIMIAGHRGRAKTMLLNPISARPLVEEYAILCLSYTEAMAEKLRAAMCRREVAIRDFFDVDHAAREQKFNPLDPVLLDLLQRKLAVPGTGRVDVSAQRLQHLERQVETQLRPVLREQDFAQFNLERAVAAVRAAEQALG